MLNALQSVFSVILMIALGLILAKRKWFEGNSSSLLSRPRRFGGLARLHYLEP